MKIFYNGVSLRAAPNLFVQKYVEKFERHANISVESENRGEKINILK